MVVPYHAMIIDSSSFPYLMKETLNDKKKKIIEVYSRKFDFIYNAQYQEIQHDLDLIIKVYHTLKF